MNFSLIPGMGPQACSSELFDNCVVVRRLAFVAGATGDVVWDRDVESGAIWWNEQGQAVFGLSIAQAEACPGRWTDRLHPDDRARFLAVVSDFLQGATPAWSAEARFQVADGTYRDFLSRGFPVRKNGARVARFIGVLTDITGQRNAERQRDRLFMLSPDPMFIGTCTGAFVSVNPAWQRAFGFTEAEAQLKNCAGMVHPDYRVLCLEQMLSPASGNSASGIECRWLCKDGSYKWILWSVATDAPGGLIYVVGKDVSQAREAEAALVAAKLAAEAANRAKSDFLRNMNHELRTPLNGVLGMNALLLDTTLSLEQKEYAETAMTSAEALLAIIDDVLEFSAFDHHRPAPEIRDFEPRRVVEEVVLALAGSAQAKGLEITCLVHAEVPSVLGGDPAWLRQVVANLVGNAIKFTSRGQIAVEVLPKPILPGEATPDHKLQLRFSVRDTGIGLSRETIAQLFQPFFQADASTTRRYSGSGLGLATCQRLVDLMGGRIGVNSTAGGGSEFWFEISFERRTESPARCTDSQPELRGLSVLVADEMQVSREVLRYYLGSFGMDVTCVADAPSALAALRSVDRCGIPFRLAIVDDRLWRPLEARKCLLGIPLIHLTPQSQRCREGGIKRAPSLARPVRQSDLLGSVVLALGLQPAPLAAVAQPVAENASAVTGRILVVEDNPVNQKLVAKMLERRGYRVGLAVNGVAAISELRRNPYDLVLMDCEMPDMDGFAATVSIRGLEAAAESGSDLGGSFGRMRPGGRLPVVALTANGSMEKCFASGMDAYLTKPVASDALARMIGQLLV